MGIVGRDGAFAEFLSLPVRNLRRVPDEIPDDEAVFVEPLAAALQLLGQVELTPSTSVAIQGDGKLGLLIAQVLARTGCRIVLLGRHASKLSLAESWGIKTKQLGDRFPASLDPADHRAYDIVVEATGSTRGLAQAMNLIRPRGTLVLKSTVYDRMPLDTVRLVVDEIKIVGSRCGRFEPALRLLAEGAVDVHSLIGDRFQLVEGIKAFARAQEPGVLKVLLEP